MDCVGDKRGEKGKGKEKAKPSKRKYRQKRSEKNQTKGLRVRQGLGELLPKSEGTAFIKHEKKVDQRAWGGVKSRPEQTP